MVVMTDTMPIQENHSIDRIRILGIELELACTRGLCGEIFSHANSF